jgi:hypothetical protein
MDTAELSKEGSIESNIRTAFRQLKTIYPHHQRLSESINAFGCNQISPFVNYYTRIQQRK